MGAAIDVHALCVEGGEPVGDLAVRHSPLTATSVSGDLVVRMIDEFPAFAAAAMYALGASQVKDAAELRTKESDRIASLAQELGALGAAVSEAPDGFTLAGPVAARVTHQGAVEVDSHGDHRLAMALAVTGLAYPVPLTVRGAGIISESYPEFVQTLAALGAQVASD